MTYYTISNKNGTIKA